MSSLDPDQFLERFFGVQSQVYGYIAMLLPNRADAEDLFQQTSLVLWKKRGQYDPGREFLSWALGIAHNEVRNFVRRRGRQNAYLSDAVIDRLAETHSAAAGRIEVRLDRLDDCMKELAADQRELIEQCYLGVKSIKTIAGERNLEPSVLYKRLDRIRWLLMDCIEAPDRREGRP
jgi:RNA polymerase sigma-70 factor, ECF subfamily